MSTGTQHPQRQRRHQRLLRSHAEPPDEEWRQAESTRAGGHRLYFAVEPADQLTARINTY